MKKFFKKSIFIVPLLLILIIVTAYLMRSDKVASEFLSVTVGENRISAWLDEDTQIYYVFLPSYSDLSNIKTDIGDDYKIVSSDVDLNDLSTASLNTEYNLQVQSHGDTLSYKLCFLKSSNTAAMYIDTQTGSMDSINADKNHKETVSVSVYDKSGFLNYTHSKDTLKGRGNVTWRQIKKPYLLTLSQSSEILSMESATKWVLLANYKDSTNMRNKLTYDIARSIDGIWAPQSEYVDLYLNGNYNGLYLLTEKVEAGDGRLDVNIDKSNIYTDFLCSVQSNSRWDILNAPFLTNGNRTIEINEPKNVTDEQASQIQKLVGQMDDDILSDNDNLSELIDVDSFAKRYLIDEISENADADLASSYFYCVYSNGQPKIYGGPIWDYDQSFGAFWESPDRNANPRAFTANTGYTTPTHITKYYHALYQKQEFYNRVVEIYKSEFLPVLKNLADNGLTDLYNTIADASYMNNVRWYDKDEDIGVEYLRTYLKERTEFLNDVWVDGQEVLTLQVEFPDIWWFMPYSVSPGDMMIDAIGEDKALANDWYIFETGEKYDPAQPIKENINIVYYNPNDNQQSHDIKYLLGLIKSHISVIVCLAGLCFMAVIIICILIKTSKQNRRRGKDERQKQ